MCELESCWKCVSYLCCLRVALMINTLLSFGSFSLYKRIPLHQAIMSCSDDVEHSNKLCEKCEDCKICVGCECPCSCKQKRCDKCNRKCSRCKCICKMKEPRPKKRGRPKKSESENNNASRQGDTTCSRNKNRSHRRTARTQVPQ